MYSESDGENQRLAAKEEGFNPSELYKLDNGEFAFNTGSKMQMGTM